MPILRYFVFVGGSLLALLFVCDAFVPDVPLPAALTTSSDRPAVRIRSERKWPERVVIDTSIPTPATIPAPVKVARTESAPAQADLVKSSVNPREAFARMTAIDAKPQQTASAQPVALAPRPATPAGEVKAELKPDSKADAKVDIKADVKAAAKRRAAKSHAATPAAARPAHPMVLVAQQPQQRFGFFDSTW